MNILAGLSQFVKADIISAVVEKHSEELYKSFTVVSPGIVRIRKGLSFTQDEKV